MTDTKELTWGEATRDADVESDTLGGEAAGSRDAAHAWDPYRNWLSRAPAPTAQRRQGIDPSLYTWKGYRNWSDRVKRNWTDRKQQD